MRRMGIILGIILMILLAGGARAISPIEELQTEIDKLSASLEMSRRATTPLEAELSRLRAKLASIQAGIDKAKADLRSLEISISEREKEFGQNYVLLAERAASFYKTSRYNSSLLILFANGSAGGVMRDLFYRRAAVDRDKNAIAEISINLIQLEADKKKAQEDKAKLDELQVKVDKEAKFFEGEISGAKAYQQKLSQQIATLNAKQQQIIAQKLGTLNLPQSLGAGALACVNDRDEKYNPGFSPAFAFFTYGIPHRVGMNQYGAYGRAQSGGQTYRQILEAYFNASIECRDMPSEINVEGLGSRNFEDYVKGVVNKEMGADIPEALKAQAVAGRSYALAYTNNAQSSICATQDCQVYSDARRGTANDAVDATGKNVCGDGRAEVLVSGGEIVKAWYSSTDGGYTYTSGEVWGSNKGWTKNLRDTTGGVGSFRELNERAYDKESKCFYAAQGWREKHGTSAWLKPEEVTDIANVILLVRKDSANKCFVYQIDKTPPSPDKECPQTGNWSADEVRQKLGGEAISSATSVEISGVDWEGGRTTQIKVNGVSFDGNEFKNYFNLRAPANIQIVGPLYNVERR